MAETPQSLGLRQLVHLGGYTLSLNPASISEVPFRAETAERVANAFTVVDRPYIFAGAPDVVQKFAWTLAWPSVNSADYNVFTEIESLPGFFDFTLWKSLFETFSGDAVATDFIMLRRLAHIVTTPPAGVTWTPVTKVDGSVVSNPTFSADDATLGTTLAAFGAPPSAASPSNIRISYTPMFKVRVVSPRRDFSIPFNEARTLTLEEI
jgi:hypothetical protein